MLLVTAPDVMGRGRRTGIAETCRSRVEPGNLPRKVQIEIAVNDEVFDRADCMCVRTGDTRAVAIGGSVRAAARLAGFAAAPPFPACRGLRIAVGPAGQDSGTANPSPRRRR